VPVARRGTFFLLHGSLLHQRLDAAVELLLQGSTGSGRLCKSISAAAMSLPARANCGGSWASVMMSCWTWQACARALPATLLAFSSELRQG
jgi:hypothetical protein